MQLPTPSDPEILRRPETRLFGRKLAMSLAADRTSELWRDFFSRRPELARHPRPDLYSIRVYEPGYFQSFAPAREFEKWAALEAASADASSADLDSIVLPAGECAVFLYRGPAADARIFQYIYGEWLPRSAYELDERPHFEVLGAKYSNTDPASEEEIWIPVRPRR